MDIRCPRCGNEFEMLGEMVCAECYHPESDHDDGWRDCLCGECEEFTFEVRCSVPVEGECDGGR